MWVSLACFVRPLDKIGKTGLSVLLIRIAVRNLFQFSVLLNTSCFGREGTGCPLPSLSAGGLSRCTWLATVGYRTLD